MLLQRAVSVACSDAFVPFAGPREKDSPLKPVIEPELALASALLIEIVPS